MPLGASVEANQKELEESSKREGTRMNKLLKKYGEEKLYGKIIPAIAHDAARRHGGE